MFSRASRQEELFGLASQPAKSGGTSTRFPPTASLSFCQIFGFGQPAAEGRTRRISAFVAAAARHVQFRRRIKCKTPATIPFWKLRFRAIVDPCLLETGLLILQYAHEFR